MEREQGIQEWQRSFQQAVRDPQELLRLLQLDDQLGAGGAAEQFPLLVPMSYLKRMRVGDPCDPLFLQVWTQQQELVEQVHFVADPVDDTGARRAPGLLHKYHGRALLVFTGQCAIHCRYCFRRHYPYAQEPKSLADWEPTLDVIRADTTLKEIILSGGDPLLVGDRKLRELWQALGEIPHVERVRVHSRLPVVLPDRVNDSLLDIFDQSRVQAIMVIHANHSAELEADCAEALGRLVGAGVMTFNQAVLLKGVNDTVEALRDLCERCIALGVVPYYLHQLDRVAGAAHFEVPVSRGLELMEELRNQLPGYAVFKYVQEVPYAASKVPLL